MRLSKKQPNKYQLGGLSSLGDVDWSDYQSVLNALGKVNGMDVSGLTPGAGGNATILGQPNPIANAILQDDPTQLENYFLKGIGTANATAQNPLLTPEQIQTQSLNQANQSVQATGNVGGMKINPVTQKQLYNQLLQAHQGQIATGLQNQNQATANTNQLQGQFNALDAQGQYGQLAGLLNMIFQEGGDVVSRLGYADDSPFSNEKELTIKGKSIDMSNTGKRLKLVPDKGEPIIAEPYSGVYHFPEANSVKEIPMKKGGKKRNYFQEGGQGAVGAQLEDGEVFVTPMLDIMLTGAKEKHKDMEKEHITDVLGPQDYVISALEKMKITRKQAEDYNFGTGGVLYEEGKKPKEPQEIKASKLFKEGEDELPLVEYFLRIRDTFKVRDEEDIFTKKTNAQNKQSRLPFLAAGVEVNEKKKNGGRVETGLASTFENKFETQGIMKGNKVPSQNSYTAYPTTESPEKMQWGGPVAAGLQLLSGIGQWIGAGQNYRDTKRTLLNDRTQINNLANTQSNFAGLSTGVGLAGYAAQNPYVEAPQYDTSELDASIRRVPKSLFDYTAARLMAANKPLQDNAFKYAGNFTDAVNAIQPAQAATLGAIAGLGAQEVQQNIGLENNYRYQKQSANDRQTMADVSARNQTTANSNRLLAGTAGTLSGGIEAQGQIQSDRINALRSNDFSQLQAKLNRRGQRNQAFQNVADTVGQAAIYTDSQYPGLFSRQDRSVAPVTPIAPVSGGVGPYGIQMPTSQYAPQVETQSGVGYSYLPPVPPPSQFQVAPAVQYSGVPGKQTGFVYNPASGQYEWHF